MLLSYVKIINFSDEPHEIVDMEFPGKRRTLQPGEEMLVSRGVFMRNYRKHQDWMRGISDERDTAQAGNTPLGVSTTDESVNIPIPDGEPVIDEATAGEQGNPILPSDDPPVESDIDVGIPAIGDVIDAVVTTTEPEQESPGIEAESVEVFQPWFTYRDRIVQVDRVTDKRVYFKDESGAEGWATKEDWDKDFKQSETQSEDAIEGKDTPSESEDET